MHLFLFCIDQIKLTVSIRSQDGTEVVRVVVADENVPLFKYILVSEFGLTSDKPQHILSIKLVVSANR